MVETEIHNEMMGFFIMEMRMWSTVFVLVGHLTAIDILARLSALCLSLWNLPVIVLFLRWRARCLMRSNFRS